jgi:hypothetical protein
MFAGLVLFMAGVGDICGENKKTKFGKNLVGNLWQCC